MVRHQPGFIYAFALAAAGAGSVACSDGMDSEFASASAELTAISGWDTPVGATVSGDDVTKTGVLGWNAGVASTDTLTADGFLQFSTAETTTSKMAGLNVANTTPSYTDIDFAIFLSSAGFVSIYESGTKVASVGNYSPNDTFRVLVNRGTVSYRRNNEVLYTSTVSPLPAFPLVADVALYTPAATVTNAGFGATWQNAVNVLVEGDRITKNASGGAWTGGASTSDMISGSGGYAEFMTNEINRAKVVGLNLADANQGYTEIDFAIYLTAAGGIEIRESGVKKASFAGPNAYAATDKFRITASGNKITYTRTPSGGSAIVLYTNNAASTARPLVLDTSLYNLGATVTGARVVETPVWAAYSGVSVTDTTLTKTNTVGWTAGASSSLKESGDCYVSFGTAETNAMKMVGLSAASASYGYAEIDYGWYLTAYGNAFIYENGTKITAVAAIPYSNTDVFRIERVGTNVTYLRNGTAVYTSLVPATGDLLVDSSLYTASPAATVNNIAFGSL